MNAIRDLAKCLIWAILREYQLFSLPMEFIIDGRECSYNSVGPIRVLVERVKPESLPEWTPEQIVEHAR